MKNDKYLKIILTIIAICLVCICVRDIKIGGNEVYAKVNSGGEEEVYVTGISSIAINRIINRIESAVQDAAWEAIQLSQPIQVTVDSPDIQK